MLPSIININDIKTTLKQHKNKVFKINYTETELLCIAKLDILINNTFSYFGDITNINPESFFEMIGNNNMKINKTLCKIVSKLAKAVCQGYEKNYAWIDIRVSMPTTDWDIPRWHMDGSFYITEDKNQIQSKFVTVLRGAGTLMVNATKKEKEEYEKIMIENRPKTKEDKEKFFKDHKNQMKLRIKQNKVFEKKKVKQLKNDEGLIFIVGNIDKALVHSEPPTHTNRIFISILPGTETQILELKKRWNR